jgi:cytochrome c-type biogenesis protein
MSDFRGKVVVLSFWSAHCRSCEKIIPGLVRLQKKYGEKLVIISINSGDIPNDGKAKLSSFARKIQAHFPLVIGNASINTNYGIENFPMTYI